MGTYLAIGIVSKITIHQKNVQKLNLTVDTLSQQLNQEVNINYYNFSEDPESYLWEIKPEILESNLVDFLTEQFNAYKTAEDPHLQAVIKELINLKDSKEILQLASNKQLMHFQMLDNFFGYIRVNIGGFDQYIDVDYDMIAYFIDGKIIMECYANLFRYLEYNIRLQKAKYPIVDCVKVMITS